jgi:dTDP-4-amino-4,6-dideoxygalactose transaminase
MISLFDLASTYAAVKSEIDAAIEALLADAQFIGGERVAQFERDFAHYLGADHVVACASGTDALEIALEALGIGPGDEVIVPAITWVATAGAVARVGATPVFADILSGEWTLDPSAVRDAVTGRTKALLPVHLYGRPARMVELGAIASEHDLLLIEDCAQAHGAMLGGEKVGSLGDAAIFSFFPTKNLGCLGDGGAMVLAKEEHAIAARQIASHGQAKRHHHVSIGRNSRLDALQAAVLSIKLVRLDEQIERKRRLAERYVAALEESGYGLPRLDVDGWHGWHLFTVTCDRRDALAAHLAKHDIQTAVHYPASLPAQPAFARVGADPASCPVARDLAATVLSLPLHAALSDVDQDRVIEALRTFAA